MTEVMDDSLSWEQRRELRRKKRQELLAEADRLVKTTEPVTSSSGLSRLARDRADFDDDDEFEKERQRRRREREERRKKEREELEQQLKEEEQQRLERDKRREERRRLREEAERSLAPVENYTSTTVVTKTVEVYDGQDNYEETTETVMETTETVTEDVPVENGRESVESSESEEAEVTNEHVEDEPTASSTINETITVTTTTVSRFDDENEDDANEVQEKLNALKMKRQQTSQKRYTSLDDDNSTPEDRQARLKELAEKRKLREEKQREEEERERERAAKREADYQEQLRIEREERERRRKEAEVKRQAYRKQLTESEDPEPTPLSPKVLTSPLVSKVEQLNKHITESPKTSKSTPVANVGSLDSRLEKYTKQASKQDVKKTSGLSGIGVNQDVSNRRNRWERGEVMSSSDKPTAKKDPVTTAGNISSRKNLWESGKVGASSSLKSSRKVDEVKGADFSSRKNLWLKATQQESYTRKSESPVGIKTGVSSRLNQWEKGEVGSNSLADKTRVKSDIITASGVGDRRAKWENIGTDSPRGSSQKTTVRVTTGLSERKNAYESKADPKDEKDDQPPLLDQDRYDQDDRSYSSQGENVNSDVDSYDDA